MTGPRHFESMPKYMGHEQRSRLALFAKDRQIRRLSGRLYGALGHP